MRDQLMHNNRYHVVRFDSSVNVESCCPEKMVALLKIIGASEIQKKSVQFSCSKYSRCLINFLTLVAFCCLGISRLKGTKGGKVFILIDEHDLFPNKLMFENFDFYNEVVADLYNHQLSAKHVFLRKFERAYIPLLL